MCTIHVLGPLLGGILAAPLHIALTHCKNRVEDSNIKIKTLKTENLEDTKKFDIESYDVNSST